MPRAKRIPSGDFVPYAPTAVGEQVNVNHIDCTAGTDTKKRLYIKRTEAGLVAFCHNCGLGGYFIASGGRVRKAKHVEVEPANDGTVYNHDTFGGARPATEDRADWLAGFLRLRSQKVQNYVRALVPEAKGVDGHPLIYLMIDPAGDIYGYQLRWTDGRLPKTKTYVNRKPTEGGWFGHPDAKTLVIVEDPLSAAIVVATMGTKVAVHCLFGTKLSGRAEASMMGYKNIVVWLDNDDAGKTASNKIAHRLSFLTAKENLVTNLTCEVEDGVPLQEPKKWIGIEKTLEPYV